jgi:hypothetical protein
MIEPIDVIYFQSSNPSAQSNQPSDQPKMDPWSPAQRDAFIEKARMAEGIRGQQAPYSFSIFPKVQQQDVEDPKRAMVTKALAATIYGTPAFRALSLKIYELIIHKIINNAFLYQFFMRDIVVMFKGGNAYAYLFGEQFPEDFQFSDLDIVIFINPYLPEELFRDIKSSLSTLVVQAISQYKRTLDHMLFINRPINDAFMAAEDLVAFKEKFGETLAALEYEGGVFRSPFESEEARNKSSRNSFVLVNSVSHADSIALVEVPHFEKCERIPLRKSPICASYNSTISFKRDHGEKAGDFDLYRLRFNCLFSKEGRDERVVADFVDISIAAQNDAELIDFWNHGRSVNILEPAMGLWVVVPDVQTCLNDLHKMLHVYDCPEHKRAKRQAKYDKIKSLVGIRPCR